MSVPCDRRKEGQLHALVLAKELVTYTVKITKNQKIFKPEYNTAITNDIIHTAKEIYMLAWRANDIRVNDPYDPDGAKGRRDERLKLQAEAIERCGELLPLIELAQSVFHLSTKRVKYWGQMTCDVRTHLRSWRTGDRKRYNF